MSCPQVTVTDPVVLQHLARARPTPRSGSFIRHGFTSRLEGTSKLSARVAGLSLSLFPD